MSKVYLNAVVDTNLSHAFGSLYVSNRPEASVPMLHNDVLPFYEKREVKVSAAVLTGSGREYCRTEARPYKIYLALNEVEHRTTKVRGARRPPASPSGSTGRPWTSSSGWPLGPSSMNQ